MAELIHSAQNFMNTEDTIIAKKKKKGEQLTNSYVHHSEQGLVQRKPKWERKETKTAKRQGRPQDGIPTTLL